MDSDAAESGLVSRCEHQLNWPQATYRRRQAREPQRRSTTLGARSAWEMLEGRARCTLCVCLGPMQLAATAQARFPRRSVWRAGVLASLLHSVVGSEAAAALVAGESSLVPQRAASGMIGMRPGRQHPGEPNKVAHTYGRLWPARLGHVVPLGREIARQPASNATSLLARKGCACAVWLLCLVASCVVLRCIVLTHVVVHGVFSCRVLPFVDVSCIMLYSVDMRCMRSHHVVMCCVALYYVALLCRVLAKLI